MAEENAVAIKLPTFWTSQPRVWFAQAEAQFVIRKITADDTKYYHVLSALDQDTATRLLDLISSPPSENKYQTLEDHRGLARKADALWAAKGMGPSANAIQKPPPKGRKAKSPEGHKDTLCYYHRRFGESARQCRDPCTWSGNGQAGRQ